MLSRSLTSCLIKPLANDFVSVINSICSFKRSVHIERHTLLGTAQGLSWNMVIEVRGACLPAHTQAAVSFKVMDGVRVDGPRRSVHTAEVRLPVGGLEEREASNACQVYKLVIMAEN